MTLCTNIFFFNFRRAGEIFLIIQIQDALLIVKQNMSKDTVPCKDYLFGPKRNKI